MGQPAQKLPAELSIYGTFREYAEYYMRRKNLSQNQLAACCRINQAWPNRVINEKIKSASVYQLFSICLVLQLNEEEAKDFLARYERALSPASEYYEAYLELIRRYHRKKIDFTRKFELDSILNEADEYLEEKGLKPLPDIYR